MSMRFHKTKKIVDGIRANISKGGISFTIGKPGRSVNIGKHGIYVNIGIPGSGASYNKKLVSFPKKFRDVTDEREQEKSAENIFRIAGKAYVAVCLLEGIVKGIHATRVSVNTERGTGAEIIDVVPVRLETVKTEKKGTGQELAKKVPKTS